MKRNSVIEIGFSLIIFLLFVFGSFFMLYYGSTVYKEGLIKEKTREDVQIPFAYLTTKIYSARNKDSITIKDDSLIIDNEGSFTCIYFSNGSLYELVVKDASLIAYSGGNKICDLDSFNISEEDNLFNIEFNDTSFKVGKR